ncbi:10055_t:CDS:2, partial [Gigaspora rosea]
SDLVPVVSSGPLEHLQVDLVDLLSHAEHNDGYSYVLTLIDIFSCYVWAIPLKDKEENTIHGELVNIFKNFGPPTKLQAHLTKMMWDEVFGSQGYRWVDVLPQFVIAYNKNKDNIPETNTPGTNIPGTISPEHILPEHIPPGTIPPGTIPLETILPGTIPPENAASQDNKALYKFYVMQVKRVHNEVVQNNKAYRNKMVIHRGVYRKKVTFELGDKVAVAPDFDNNQKTQKCKLEQTCSITGKFVSVCNNNRMVRVDMNGKIKNFATKNLKKLRE